MAQVRSSQKIWDAASVSQNDTSAQAEVGRGPWNAVYITSSVTATFNIEAGVTDSSDTTLDDTDTIQWFTLNGHTALIVVGGTSVCYDLSPFGPQYIRLVRTDSGSASTVTAYTSDFGPN